MSLTLARPDRLVEVGSFFYVNFRPSCSRQIYLAGCLKHLK
jgi:hypothetical protein